MNNSNRQNQTLQNSSFGDRSSENLNKRDLSQAKNLAASIAVKTSLTPSAAAGHKVFNPK